MLTRSALKVTLEQVMAVPGVGAQVMASLPVSDRVRLRLTCRSFRAAADESLLHLTDLFGEDIAGSRTGKPVEAALTWLLTKCPNLTTLSVASRAYPGAPWQMRDRWLRSRLWSEHEENTKGMPPLEIIAARYRGLTCLDVSACVTVTDAGLIAIAQTCCQLIALDVSGCDVGDASITSLAASCPGLLRVAVFYCRRVTDASLASLGRHCHQLEELDVGYTQVTDDGLTQVAAHCHRLRRLCLSNCDRVTNVGIRQIGEGCPRLRWVDLPLFSTRVWDRGIRSLVEHCGNLRRLNLAGLTEITDDSVLTAAHYCPQLEFLDVARCTIVSDEGIEAVADKCPRLRHLSVAECFQVTDASISKVAKQCRRLRELVLRRSGITAASIDAIAASCRELRYLDMGREIDSTPLYSAWGRPRPWNHPDIDGSLAALAQGCPQLEYLNVTSFLTEMRAAMAALGRYSVRLRVLKAGGNFVRDGDVSRLVQKRGHQFQSLGFSNTLVTEKAVVQVARKCAQLVSLSLRNCQVAEEGISVLRQQGFGWCETTQSAFKD
eukprot:jgi/Mesvir1/25943/Mv20937-RA.1